MKSPFIFYFLKVFLKKKIKKNFLHFKLIFVVFSDSFDI